MEQFFALVPDGLNARRSHYSHRTAIRRLRRWMADKGLESLDRNAVVAWKQSLLSDGLAPRTVSCYLTSVKSQCREAVHQNLMDAWTAAQILSIRGVPVRGSRTRRWLTVDQAQKLFSAPDRSTLKGVRDAAIMGLMLGGGLRRSEVCDLYRAQIHRRQGKMVIADLTLKSRVRTVPVADWAAEAVKAWLEESGIRRGRVILRIDRGGGIMQPPRGIHPQSIYAMILEYSDISGVDCRPHDLRRTYAGLSYEGGADLRQIQMALGHTNTTTTELYLGLKQDLSIAPGDFIKLHTTNGRH